MKKFISILLVLVVVASCFVGCSSQDEQEKEPLTVSFKNTYDTVYANYDKSVFNAYDDVCNAIIGYENFVRMNTSLAEDVKQLLYTSFPLVFLTSSVDKSSDDSGLEITFKYSEDEHRDKVKAFDDKIKEIQTECGFSKSNDGVYLLNVYNYVAKNVKISENTSISSYETIMNGEGSVYSYSNMFEYLLQQKGIDAFHIIAEDAGGAGWSLSCAALNGIAYFFDVASEHYATNGEGIYYFAMTYSDLEDEGIKNPTYSIKTDVFKCRDESFKACRSCKEWKLNGNTLEIHTFDEKTESIELK